MPEGRMHSVHRAAAQLAGGLCRSRSGAPQTPCAECDGAPSSSFLVTVLLAVVLPFGAGPRTSPLPLPPG
eukprot:894042-Pyramimonas_sp.AAC.1